MEENESGQPGPADASKLATSGTRRRLCLSELGATSIEYGVIAGLLALALYVGTQVAGNGLDKVFALIGVTVQNATNQAEQNTGN